MTETRNGKTIARVVYLWTAFGLVLTSAILAVVHFQSEVIPYVPLAVSLLTGTAVIFALLTWRLLAGKVKNRYVIPANIWGGVIIAIAIAGFAFTVPSFHNRFFMSSAPYLTWTGDQDPSSSITICWVSTFPGDSSLRYGTSPTSLASTVTGAPGATKYHKVALAGLLPNTTYYYSAGGLPVKQFTTAPVGTFNFTFFVWSDPRQNNDIMTARGRPNTPLHMHEHAVANNIDVAFSICTGDITSTAFDYETWNLWYHDIGTHDWAVNRSHVVAFGNHERHGNPEGDAIVQFYPQARRPDGRFWYSFNYSNVHLIMLDTYDEGSSWLAEFTPEHLAWLEADLQASASIPFKFAFMHPPAYNAGGTQTPLQAELHRLAAQYNISMVMTGHAHHYQNNLYNGTRYIIQGIGGNANNNFRDLDCNVAFSVVEVRGTTATVKVTWINGTVHDQFTLNA